jgi:hypothetical protein
MVNIRRLEGVEVDRLEPHLFDGRNWDQSVAALTGAGQSS